MIEGIGVSGGGAINTSPLIGTLSERCNHCTGPTNMICGSYGMKGGRPASHAGNNAFRQWLWEPIRQIC